MEQLVNRVATRSNTPWLSDKPTVRGSQTKSAPIEIREKDAEIVNELPDSHKVPIGVVPGQLETAPATMVLCHSCNFSSPSEKPLKQFSPLRYPGRTATDRGMNCRPTRSTSARQGDHDMSTGDPGSVNRFRHAGHTEKVIAAGDAGSSAFPPGLIQA